VKQRKPIIELKTVLRNFKDTMKLMYKTCIDLTHKHELKSENKNAPKAQIQNYKTALKLKQTTKSRNNQHHTDLLTF